MGLRVILLMGLSLGSLCTASAAQEPAPAALRYDGVYRSQPTKDDDTEYCAYLRFYPKGTVLTVSSECTADTPADLKKWFVPAHSGPTKSGVSSGRFHLAGDRLTFTAVSKEGRVSYAGTVDGERIELDQHSYINGVRFHETYSFVKW